MNESEEQDTYVSQLREVFQSCDIKNKGFLNREELILLCHKLQLTEKTNIFVYQLLGDDPNAKVGFDEFKEGFVSLLTESVGLADAAENDNDEETGSQHLSDREVSPKFVLGTKKYGRRSRPVFNEDGGTPDYSDSELLCVPIDGTPSLLRRSSLTKNSVTDVDNKMECSYESPIKYGSNGNLPMVTVSSDQQVLETFESETNPHLDVPMESDSNLETNPEEYLQGIWKKLGVGKDGYLNLEELARVCERIGMEMSDEVVTQLFEKLDCDQDGKVSFEEFLQGLFQHGGPQTTELNEIQITDSPLHKNKFYKEDSQEDHQMAVVTSESGIFSSIDPENTGYADSSTIVELWDNLGLSGGIRVLKDLGFNANMKINLQNLTSMLEDELMSASNSTLYKFAMLTYQNELRHVKVNYDQAAAEREKLRMGIAEANGRAALLAQEVDDHHAKLEKSSQNKLMYLEKKYQDQMKELQDELQRERDILAGQTNRIKQQFQREINVIREEEGKLRNRLTVLEQENSRLEQEVMLATEKCMEAERLKDAQQRELETVTELKQRVAELESGRGLLREQHYQSLLQELESYKNQNKELQDQIDELTLEVESLRQQLANSSRPQGKRHRITGSWLSDYTKDNNSLKRRGSGSSSEDNSDDDSPIVGKVRRRILMLPREDQNRVPFEVEKLKEHHKEELDRLRIDYEKVVKDIETSYKNRVTELESQLESQFLWQPEVDRDQVDSQETIQAESQDTNKNEETSRILQLQDEVNQLKEKLSREIKERDNLISQNEQSLIQLKDEMEILLKQADEKLQEQLRVNHVLQNTLHQEKREMENNLREEQEKLKRLMEEELEKRVKEAKKQALLKAKEEVKKELQQLTQNHHGDDITNQMSKDLRSIIQTSRQNRLCGEEESYDSYLQQEVEELLTRTLRIVEARLESNHLQEQEKLKQQWEEEMNQLTCMVGKRCSIYPTGQQQIMERLEMELQHKEELQMVCGDSVAVPQAMEVANQDRRFIEGSLPGEFSTTQRAANVGR
ncbi:ninein-like protein isoform X2 [Centruroides vittatus]|uniref:ninein-like protein isoform X2 n=1 Tax=Centruroides vittatus TaxID=120091 RepID=UPI00350EE7B6